MFTEDLRIAYTKSDEICKSLNYKSNSLISTQDIVNIVKEQYCPNLNVYFVSFADLGVNCTYGAMMRTVLNEDGSVADATILINSTKAPKFQRFSLVHELGHLVTRTWHTSTSRADDSSLFAISTHISYDVASIGKEEYTNNGYLLRELIANIFALRVLMPSELFYKKLKSIGNISEVAKFFGLNECAVISRAMIGA